MSVFDISYWIFQIMPCIPAEVYSHQILIKSERTAEQTKFLYLANEGQINIAIVSTRIKLLWKQQKCNTYSWSFQDQINHLKLWTSPARHNPTVTLFDGLYLENEKKMGKKVWEDANYRKFWLMKFQRNQTNIAIVNFIQTYEIFTIT